MVRFHQGMPSSRVQRRGDPLNTAAVIGEDER